MTSEDPPSKSQRKRDMHALQSLGQALSELSPERIRALELPDSLEQALLEIRSLRAHGAIRRQMQYIGRLMRTVDPAPLQDYLERLAGTSRAATATLHQTERWRERMLEDITVVDEFAAAYPEADRQQLRQLVQGAQRERATDKPPRPFRAVFRALSRRLAPPGRRRAREATLQDPE